MTNSVKKTEKVTPGIPLSDSRAVFERRVFFHTFLGVDDYTIMMLSIIDQARVLAENAIKELSKNKKLYRNKVKEAGQMIYNPNGNSIDPEAKQKGLVFKGWTKRIETMVMRNMKEDEYERFSIVCGSFDELIQEDLFKFNNSIMQEVGRNGFVNQSELTIILKATLFCIMAKNIIDRSIERGAGRFIALCKEPSNEESRNGAFWLTCNEINKILKYLDIISTSVGRGNILHVPELSPVCTSMDIIYSKLINSKNIYGCAAEAGIDLHLTSCPENTPEAQEAKRAARRINIETKKQPEISDKTVENLADAKGWKIKTK